MRWVGLVKSESLRTSAAMSGDTSHALRSAASAAAVTGMRTRLGHLSSGDLLGLRFALAGLFAWGRRGRGVFFYSLFLGLRASKFSSTYSRVIFAELLGPLGSESHTLLNNGFLFLAACRDL